MAKSDFEKVYTYGCEYQESIHELRFANAENFNCAFSIMQRSVESGYILPNKELIKCTSVVYIIWQLCISWLARWSRHNMIW